MSLRLRLTLLYSTLMGGISLTFGAAVYIIISVLLLNQADTTLASTARDIMAVTRVNSVAEIDVITLPPLDMTSNVYVQLWGEDNKIRNESPSIANLTSSLDPIGLKAGEPIYRENAI